MAGPLNAIGEFLFISLLGQPQTIKRQVELMARPGVDGIGVWRTGKRGRPFTLRSQVDAIDKADGRDLYRSYAALIGEDPVNLTWSDLDLETEEDLLVFVLDVRLVDLRTIAASTGGLIPDAEGWLECDWDLVAVAPSEE